MPGHILVAGHFGCGNLGDDAILLGFVAGMGDGTDMTVMSGAPEETYRNYGLRSIPRKDLNAFGEALQECDALVFAGGSIFQDATSARSAIFYGELVKRAKKAGKRVIMVGQGVGPLNSFFGKRAATAAFNMADYIVTRDPGSVSTLKSLGVKRPIKVAADLAFLMPPLREDTEGQSFAVGNMKTVGISPRPFGKDKKSQVQLFGELSRMLFQANYLPVLIEMDREHDAPLIIEISKSQGGKVPEIRKLQTPMQLQSRMSRMDAVIAMRLHAGILATTVGVPALMVSYDPKVASFAKMLDMGTSVSIEGLTANRLFESFVQFHKERERNLKILERKRAELRKAAELNVEMVLDSLSGKATIPA